jgi:DNA modification methylase
MSDLRFEQVGVADLRPNPHNVRLHSKKQISQIAGSIGEFGFNIPVVIDEQNLIIAGHGRVEAARLLNMSSVPCVRVAHLTETQKRLFALADNKIALNAEWDVDMLKVEFSALSALELDVDLETTGFATAEIDLLIDGPTKPSNTDPSDIIPELESTAVSKLGDVWLLGPHKLVCGDARDGAVYSDLMNGEKARVVFADVPYNVPIDGHVGGLGAVKHREFKMAAGEMTATEFTSFLSDIFRNVAEVSLDGAIHFICMDWRHMAEVMAAAAGVYSGLKNVCVWNKNNGGMGSFYRSKHEMVFVYKVGNEPHTNTIELGKGGRYRTNVWDYAGANTWRAGRDAELEMHPTVKPTALVIDAIKDCSRRGDIVVDPCGGSGTTMIAAHKCRRRARLIELDPLYVDVTIRRWQGLTGQLATMDITGETFADAAERRRDPLQ